MYVVVRKRIAPRFFLSNADGGAVTNPPPGTVVDSQVTRPNSCVHYIFSTSANFLCCRNLLHCYYRPRSRGDNTFGSVRVCVCVSVRLSVGALLFKPFDLWLWFLAWGSKIVYAHPFEPVVWSRSILGLGLPSSANGNCEDHYQSIGIVCFSVIRGRSTYRA